MTSGIRLLALIALIALSLWLGYLLGKGNENQPSSQTQAIDFVAPVSEQTVSPSTDLKNLRADQLPSAIERANQLGERIDALAAQTDDQIIARDRYNILNDLTRELKGADAARFAGVLRYYNTVIPRDGAAVILEARYFQLNGQRREAIDLLIAASEFPESNEQLKQIQDTQAELIDAIFKEHAAIEDWAGLINYFESLLLLDPNNDRIRLQLANTLALSGNVGAAIETLEITGTEGGVSQSEINRLRDELKRAEVEPIRFRAQGDSLIANATLNSSPIELLVDTGATKTALATSVLQQLGAVPLNESAQVLTAGGRIRAQLYEVPELIVEQTRFRNTVVLALDNPPANWDGLLGMDLLRNMNVDLSNQLSDQLPDQFLGP